jgi:hypothetical protein
MKRILTFIVTLLILVGMVSVGSWYGSSISFGTGSDATHCLALGDFDKDGNMDIAVGNFGGQNRVYFGDGDGTFDSRQVNIGPGNDLTQSIITCDVNNDTWPDIVVGNEEGISVSGENVVYINDGDGTFDTTFYTFDESTKSTFALAAYDINGDNWVDLAVGDLNSLNYVYFNDGTGNPYDTPANKIPFGVDMNGDSFLDPLDTWDLVFADMNGDGDIDIVEANHQTWNHVYLGDGTGNFSTAYAFGLDYEFTHSIAVGYLDGDAVLDVVVGNYQGQNRAYLGNGTGGMGTSYNFGPSGTKTQAVALSDVNGDTILDVAVADGGDVDLVNKLYLGNGDGTFGTSYNIGNGDTSWDLKFWDFNGDTLIDIAVGNMGQDYIFLNTQTAFESLANLFDTNTFFVAGDTAYCTDVLGSSKIAFGLGKGGASENPEGRTDVILTTTEHDTGNLIIVGGPAVDPVADEFDNIFGITYTFVAGVSFEIQCEGYTIFLDIANDYPQEDICIVYIGEQNGRNVMLVWGYGWYGTYAGSAYIGETDNWVTEQGYHMLMIRWNDTNSDGLIQAGEITVEQRN